MKIYISGAITNDPDYLAKFDRVEKHLTALNFEVVNPTKLQHDHNKSYKNYMKEDIRELLNCDAIFMIYGWDKSAGAKLEKKVADACGLEAIYGGEI